MLAVRLIGFLQLSFGVALMIGGVSATIAWFAFCFGTVIIGILLLIFFPPVLFFPTGLIFWGIAQSSAGLKNIFSPKQVIRRDHKERYDRQSVENANEFPEPRETKSVSSLPTDKISTISSENTVLKNLPHNLETIKVNQNESHDKSSFYTQGDDKFQDYKPTVETNGYWSLDKPTPETNKSTKETENSFPSEWNMNFEEIKKFREYQAIIEAEGYWLVIMDYYVSIIGDTSREHCETLDDLGAAAVKIKLNTLPSNPSIDYGEVKKGKDQEVDSGLGGLAFIIAAAITIGLFAALWQGLSDSELKIEENGYSQLSPDEHAHIKDTIEKYINSALVSLHGDSGKLFVSDLKFASNRLIKVEYEDGHSVYSVMIKYDEADIDSPFHLHELLDRRTKNYHPFTITVTPKHARVRIMNIKPKYVAGMALADGSYDVLVDAPGYHSWRQPITHTGEATNYRVTLTKKPIDKPESARQVTSSNNPLIDNRYKDNGDGTVTDVITNLQWMRCSVGQTWTGTNCVGEAELMSWGRAINQTADFAGYHDWGSPTIQELNSLVYCFGDYPFADKKGHGGCRSSGGPTINQNAFPNTPASNYWSLSDGGWFVSFRMGGDSDGIGSYRTNEYFAVRLVRSAQ